MSAHGKTSNAPVHVLLIDDYPVAREALPALLARNDIFVSATVASPAEAEEAFDRHNPAVALVGVTRAGEAQELTRRLARIGRPPRVLVRTHERDLPDIEQNLPEGVSGAVSRRTSLEDLVQAIRTVAAGGTWFEPPDERYRRDTRTATLSKQERRVLIELARGSTTEEIAETMHVTTHTVRSHIRNLVRKLRAKSRAHAVAIAYSEGMIDTKV
ncbi:MAG: response regulator transcription factor [Thermoleophilaceae bacterium]